jgi:type IV pilus assembly protein PilQ
MYDCSHMISGMKFGRSISGLFLSILLLFLLSVGCASVPEKQDAELIKANPRKMINGIDSVVGADTESVIIRANKQLNFTSVKQHDPLGVILLFPETTIRDVRPELAPDSEIIKSIISSLSPDQKNTRLEIGLNVDSPYEVKKEGENINVVFLRRNTNATSENPAVEGDGSFEKEMDKGSVKEEIAPAEYGNLEKRNIENTSTEPAVINRIDFSTQESEKSMSIVGTDSPVEFDIQKIAAKTLKVRVYNSRLPEYRRHRPLITTRFESAVDRISPIQAADLEDATDLIVELREWVPYRPVVKDNLLTIVFDKSSIGPRPFEAANLPDWQKVLEAAAYSVPDDAGYTKEITESKEDRYADLLGEKKEYTGEKIALDFYKTDIKNVFRILQQVSGKNYAIDKNVTGEVTISLEKPVPWDQVLDLILKMNQLGMVEQGDIIRIATTATLSAEEVAQQKKMQAIKERIEQAKKLEPLVTEYIPINYANAQSEILKHIDNIKTKDRGNITVDDRNNQLIITDTRPILRKMAEIISQIDKVTPQVLIEARIVEVNDDFDREIGVSWGASGEDIYKGNMDGQYSYNIAMNEPIRAEDVSTGQGIIDFNFTRLDAWGTPIVLDAALKALESSGQGKIISSPKILTLDNKKAIIKQGQQFPYQTVEDNEVNIEFQDVDLSLEVTPHVTPDRRVALKIKTTKNEIVGFISTGDPIISTNEADTELLVDDGETIVIGGVVKNSMQYTESGFPILQDIPMIGWLFKNKIESNAKSELLIFLTPSIVQLAQREMVRAEN